MPFRRHIDGKPQPAKKVVKSNVRLSMNSSKCPICNSLSKQQLATLDEALSNPECPLSSEAASKQYGLAEHDVARHLHKCLFGKNASRYARVARAFDKLWDAIDLAHETYMARPDMYNGTAYQALLKQLRAMMVDLENVQNGEELAADLTQFALNPMITSITQAVISESGGLKDDLTAKFDEQEADRLVGDFVRRLALHFKRAAETAHERILDTVSARDKNRLKASQSPGRPKKPQGKHANLRSVG